MPETKVPEPVEIGKFTRTEPVTAGEVAIGEFLKGKTFSEMAEVLRSVAETNKTPATPASPEVATSVSPEVATSVSPEVATPATTATSIPSESTASSDMVAELEKKLSDMQSSPAMTYEQRVKAHGLTVSEALEIASKIIDQGYYEEAVKLTPRHSVVFRTRTTEDQDRVIRRIEAENPQFPATITSILAKYNIAASLQRFKNIDFSKLDFEQRYAFVCRLPETVLRLLSAKLAKFDAKIQAVMDEGMIENF